MPTFVVQFSETTQYEITIEAEDMARAIQKIRSLDYDPDDLSTTAGGSRVDIDSVVAA